jgi:hypothetical protein
MEQTDCAEALAFKLQILENLPEESIQHSVHDKSLKSRTLCLLFVFSISVLCDGIHAAEVTVDDLEYLKEV